MAISTISIGRLVLREDLNAVEVGDASGTRAISISGQESIPRLTADQVAKRREDLLSIGGQFLPVLFTVKSYLNGFYQIESISGAVEDWDYNMRIFPWDLSMVRFGTVSEVDIESRLSGAVSRQNNFLITGQRVHAPAIGHFAYWSDATVTSTVSRETTDGQIQVYRGLQPDISPRWAINPLDYMKGRVRFLDDEGIERAGSSLSCPGNDWELNNGLVRIRPTLTGETFEIAAWSGSAWEVKNWDLSADGVVLTDFDTCSVLDNQVECVTVRLMKAMVNGRLYVDLTLRRGFRIVEVYMQSEFGVDFKIVRSEAEAGTNAVGGIVSAGANDADGNMYVVGSARTFNPDIVNGGIEKAASSFMDAFIGVAFGGDAAIPGDLPVDLQAQYIGAPSELVQGVQR